MRLRKIFTCIANRVAEVAILQRIVLFKYLFILAGAGLIAGIVIIIILALVIIGLLVYWLFWRRRQNGDSDIEFHNKNSKKRPISPKELGMCIHWEKIHCGNSNHFMPLFSFFTPCKRQKTTGFLMFLGGIERDQCWKFIVFKLAR